GRGKRALLVARLDPRSVRQDPELQEVNDFHTRRVVLAMGDAAPGAHVLKLVLAEHGAFPSAVLVCQGTIENVGEYLHVPVLMRAESSTGLQAVFVDDPQPPEPYVAGVAVVAERERVPALEPRVVGAAPGGRRSQHHHLRLVQPYSGEKMEASSLADGGATFLPKAAAA